MRVIERLTPAQILNLESRRIYAIACYPLSRDSSASGTDNRAHGRDRMLVRSFYKGQTFLYELVKALSTAQ